MKLLLTYHKGTTDVSQWGQLGEGEVILVFLWNIKCVTGVYLAGQK